MLASWNSVPRLKFHRGASNSEISGPAPKFFSWSVVAGCRCDRIQTPFAQTSIAFRSVIGIAYKTSIRKRRLETLVAHLLPQVIRRHFGVEIPSFRTPKLRFWPTISPFQSNVSLDHVNLGRGGHTESSSHSDRKLCSTRHENSSLGRRYGNVSLDHVNPGQGGHMELASHGDRKLCSTRCENSSP
ncbi:hypothetical protein Taro_027445, partial [Colocasia esculenta]|nr:hypothetical protein [Colocasia esculenta]